LPEREPPDTTRIETSEQASAPSYYFDKYVVEGEFGGRPAGGEPAQFGAGGRLSNRDTGVFAGDGGERSVGRERQARIGAGGDLHGAVVAAVNRVDELVRFLNEVAGQGRVRLLTIPRAAARSA